MTASWHRTASHITGPLWGESTAHPCIPLTKDHECGALRFIRWYSEESSEQVVARVAWWRHKMMDFPSQRPVMRSVDVFFHMRLNKRLSQQSRPRCDFKCHCAHYDITVLDRDFRRRDTHVVAPYWCQVLVLTTQGKCFPNFKARPWFKRYISLQWRCMSNIMSQISVNTSFVQERYSCFILFNV